MTSVAKVCVFFFLFAMLSSCKKESLYWGEASTLKNGVEWGGEIRTDINNLSASKVDISIKTTREDGFWENLYFFKVPLSAGKYILSEASNQPPDDSLVGGKFFVGYDDELHDIYKIAQNDSTSYIEITDYSEGSKELKGRFSLVLWPDLANSPNAPDSIVFSSGVFHARIND
jgi:hypothetical protein